MELLEKLCVLDLSRTLGPRFSPKRQRDIKASSSQAAPACQVTKAVVSSNIHFSGTPSAKEMADSELLKPKRRAPRLQPPAALSKDTLGTSHDLPGSGGPPGEPMQLLSACKWSCALQICTCNLRIHKPRFVGRTNVWHAAVAQSKQSTRLDGFWTSTRRSRLVPRFRGEANFSLSDIQKSPPPVLARGVSWSWPLLRGWASSTACRAKRLPLATGQSALLFHLCFFPGWTAVDS